MRSEETLRYHPIFGPISRVKALQEVLDKLNPYVMRQLGSFLRVTRLVKLAIKISDWEALQDQEDLDDPPRLDSAEEILRAAVVLLHAQLEDFLRTLAQALLPEGSEACLKEIPLVGLGRQQKFHLGNLAKHRGKLVEDLLKESVAEHLKDSNYGSTHAIARLLTSLGFDASKHNGRFPAIQKMIERRHQIVHRADLLDGHEEAGKLVGPFNAITTSEVEEWRDATEELMRSLIDAMAHNLSGGEFGNGEQTVEANGPFFHE